MQKVFRITVDISKKIPAPAFEVNTNDLKSVKLEITITNGLSLLDLTDVTPRINIRKPDNEVIFQDCEIVDATAGKVQIILENQAYLVPGTHTAEIACYKGNEITAITGTFSYKSLKGIMNDEAVESKSEFTVITRTLNEVQKVLEDAKESGGFSGVDEQARQEIEEVIEQLSGTVKEVNGVKPVNGKVTIPTAELPVGGVTTEKYANDSITRSKMKFDDMKISLNFQWARIPTFSVSGPSYDAKLTIAFNTAGGFLTAVDALGDMVKQINQTTLTTVFTLSNNEALYWDFTTNTITKTKPTRGITLCYWTTNQFQYGALLEYYNESKISKLSQSTLYQGVSFSDGTSPSITVMHDRKIKVEFPKVGFMYSIKRDGIGYHGNMNMTGQEFTLLSGETLLWNTSSNTLVKSAVSTADKSSSVVLIHNSYGVIPYGALLPWYLGNDGMKKRRVHNAEGRAKIIKNFAADQGMTIIGDKICVFRHGADDHLSYGNIEVFNKDTFEHLGKMEHNLGHASSADYNVETDTLIVTNGNLTYNGNIIYPEIYLIPNASQLNVGSKIEYDSVMKINMYVKTDGSITKTLADTGITWTFGEKPYLLYGHAIIKTATGVSDASTNTFYKVLLGTGTNDFSDATGTDLTKWGTFISGKSAKEFNGTAKILKTFKSHHLGTNQGICFHDGDIYLAVSTEAHSAEVIRVKLFENGTVEEVKRYLAPNITPSGAIPSLETEGCAILDGRYLIAGYRSTEIQELAIFPLYNEQGGKGTTGTRITLPFACNNEPQIRLTPTSNVTDLYVSQVDTKGFTVLSSSGKTGTFNWECRIS